MLKNAPLLILDEVSSALDADRILVLEQGEILNEGTHDMLISQGGRYTELASYMTKNFDV